MPAIAIADNQQVTFNFGISGYQPHWLTGLLVIKAIHGHQLGQLIGRRLTRTALMWDVEDDQWWADGPVVLDFDGEQMEINHFRTHDLSIIWNTIDLD